MLPTHASKVLVCLRYGIGDVVMELPALKRLRDVLPRAHITVLAAHPARELLDGGALADRVVLVHRWGIRHRWDPGDAGMQRAIAAWVDEEGFDLFLDVGHASTAFRSAVEAQGIHWLEADRGEERRAIAEGRSGVVAIARAVREGWGMELDEDAAPVLDVREEDRAFAAELLGSLGLSGSTPVAVSPVASSRLKRWPVHRFARLADALVERGKGPLLLLAGPQRETGEAVRERMEHGSDTVLVGAHHLLRTAALLTRCEVLVCNDTGLMHLAAAVGTRTVAVFGPTSATLYRPPVRHARAVESRVPCHHRAVRSLFPPACWDEDRCLIMERGCVDAVDVAEVLAAVRDLEHGMPDHPGAAPTPFRAPAGRARTRRLPVLSGAGGDPAGAGADLDGRF